VRNRETILDSEVTTRIAVRHATMDEEEEEEDGGCEEDGVEEEEGGVEGGAEEEEEEGGRSDLPYLLWIGSGQAVKRSIPPWIS